MKIAVLKNNGEETGRKISLSEDIFGIRAKRSYDLS